MRQDKDRVHSPIKTEISMGVFVSCLLILRLLTHQNPKYFRLNPLD
jgi:hypothetical protein